MTETNQDPTSVRLGDHDYPPIFAAIAWSHQDPQGYVLALHEAEKLGYLKASDEWTHGIEPLSERLQDVAHRLVESGRLPAEAYGLESQ